MVRRILGKRRAETGSEYKMRREDAELPKSEPGNVRRLLQELEALRRARRARRGSKPRKVTSAGKY